MLILVRHGESTGNADGLLLGRIDSPLTERGLEQARSLAGTVAGATRLISSPLARARDTAEALGTGLPVEIDDRWVEVDYGEFDGQKLGDMPAEVWRAWRSDTDFMPPGGESLASAGARVREACEELFADPDGPARGTGHGSGGEPRVADQGGGLLVARPGGRGCVAALPGQRLGHPDHLGCGRDPGAGRVQRHALVEPPLSCGPGRASGPRPPARVTQGRSTVSAMTRSAQGAERAPPSRSPFQASQPMACSRASSRSGPCARPAGPSSGARVTGQLVPQEGPVGRPPARPVHPGRRAASASRRIGVTASK